MSKPPAVPVIALAVALTAAHALAIVVASATRSDFSADTVSVRTFDRFTNRPGEVGGGRGDMNSLTHTDWDLGYTFTYTTDTRCDCGRPRTTITIRAFHVTGNQHTTIYLPSDATPQMKAHEQAHYDLNTYAYGKAIDRAAVFSRGMLRKTYEGCSVDDALARLNDDFNANFKDPYARWRDALHTALNRLDDDGHCPTCTPAQAYRQVIAANG